MNTLCTTFTHGYKNKENIRNIHEKIRDGLQVKKEIINNAKIRKREKKETWI